MEKLTDFPKIHCPFVRKIFKINEEDWKERRRELKLRKPEVYLVVNEVNPGYEWVFEDADTICVEKLDGTNVKILTEDGIIKAVQNRMNVIELLSVIEKNTIISEGIFESISKGYIEHNGEQCGEIIGDKVQGNPYGLDFRLWYPFSRAIKHLRYRSFHEHDRTFEDWSMWFKDYLFSRFATKLGKKDIMAEGVVFYNLKRKAEGKVYMAKLRRSYFSWFYDVEVG